MSIERVSSGNKTLTLIRRFNKNIEGIEFYTPKNYPSQMGAQIRKIDESIINSSEQMIPYEKYRKILENIPICNVDIFVLCHNNKVLLVKRNREPASDPWFNATVG